MTDDLRDLTVRALRKVQRHLGDESDLVASGAINTEGVKTVCLALGPYRNLTTLTAAILFLHPNCQVLNHAARRIYGNRRVNFLSGYSDRKFERFLQYAIYISTKGTRGNNGGSIIHSHAFDARHPLRQYVKQDEGEVLKQKIESFFWKESLKTSNTIRDNNVDLGRLFQKNAKLRFLLPIRNPMDCAVSNLKTGHIQFFSGLGREPSQIEVCEAILKEILWVMNLQERYPDRFFHYFEHEVSREMLLSLAAFLRLEPDEEWLDNALAVMKAESHYEHRSELISFYEQYVDRNFAHLPVVAEKLRRFLEPVLS